ncbi:hypothetical protein, partial [Profundicola chukchiensis]|uniref:hypothetical protein n=1 Tax=Profundicola chukchiensis TaxID=2961959 RepID=UPI0026F39EDF
GNAAGFQLCTIQIRAQVIHAGPTVEHHDDAQAKPTEKPDDKVDGLPIQHEGELLLVALCCDSSNTCFGGLWVEVFAAL